ncbi:MAG: hypothetical protein EXR24_01120 [Ignavibacteria bacterium]|nr:hypothetical protein [Bacteroidota bacterium]MSQ45571.1 hypothetical protein [Ignavibacteria bacterium]
MIPLIIFYLHIVAALYILTYQYQKENIASGFVSLSFFLLIFSVGWSICTYISTLILEPEGFGFYLDRNTISLILLSVSEATFYFVFFRETTSQQN